MSEKLDSKALTRAAEKIREAIEQARLAYQFNPSSYTNSTFQACLDAGRAFDRHIAHLAYANSAEWLRKFPPIVEHEHGKKEKNSAKAGGQRPELHQLFRYVMDCPAYASLSCYARVALIEITRGYNGSNNGMLVLSVRQLAEGMGCALNTANRALWELIDKGFIEPRIKGAFSVKFKRATEWRLNDRRCDVTGEQSQAFLKWQDPTPMKSISRSHHVRPNGLTTCDTRNFSDAPSRSHHVRHSSANNGLTTCDTSVSTTVCHLEAVGGGAPHSAVAAADERPDWATPVLTEAFGEERNRLLKNLAKSTKRKQTCEETDAEMAARGLPLNLSSRRRRASESKTPV